MKILCFALVVGLSSLSVVGCKGIEPDAVGPLDAEQTRDMKALSNGVELGAVAIHADSLVQHIDGKLSKTTDDWLERDCFYEHQRDSDLSGVVVRKTGNCPIDADWSLRGENTDSVKVKIGFVNDENLQYDIPVKNFYFSGDRITKLDHESKDMVTTSTYNGTIQPFSLDDSAKVKIVRVERDNRVNYQINISYKGYTVNGRLSDNSATINGESVSIEDFHSVFFVLK